MENNETVTVGFRHIDSGNKMVDAAHLIREVMKWCELTPYERQRVLEFCLPTELTMERPAVLPYPPRGYIIASKEEVERVTKELHDRNNPI